MFKPIDFLLDRITMYRLLLYYLIALLAIAAGLGFAGVLHYNGLAIIFSASYLTLICWITHEVFARAFEAPANIESSLITALILALIITPYKDSHDILFMTAAAGLAISSKYILQIRHQHIFNPAAVAVALTAIGPGQIASWWVGSSQMLPYVAIGGLLLIRKIQRGQMVTTFVATAIASQAIVSILGHHNLGANLKQELLHSSLWFLAFVMLTEPSTSPGSNVKRSWYAGLVGALFPPQVHIFGIFSTPERALLIGNIFSYIVSPKTKLLLRLKQKEVIAKGTMEFVFGLNRPLDFKPGQYMEFTLPHHGMDSRGSRRYFTLASSPTENELHLGVKFYANGSSFKHAMRAMESQTMFGAAQLGGDFVLPADQNQKLAFIAGGIGVTPFRSMLKYLADKAEKRDVALLYSERTADRLAYKAVFTEAEEKVGAKVIYTLTDEHSLPANWGGATGFISDQMIEQAIPDFGERLFYISGPQPMVEATKSVLHKMGVPRHKIRTDFFPGYA
ncbi:MAG TPA: RnfABCDGE type electron transport complex subunit D [Candidatus Saccharimonadia bacterium]|nr:RnfABCDGE type electron transport complex subunit D [Candidatus Saccharimonadia bacterium]